MRCMVSDRGGLITWRVKNEDQTPILERVGDKSGISSNLAAIHSYD